MTKGTDDNEPRGHRFSASDYVATEVDDAQMAESTLSGDVRDVLLTHLRSIMVPWTMLSEEEQREKIFAVSKCADDLVRRVIGIVTAKQFPTVVVELKEWKVKGGIELKCAASSLIENITHLAEHGPSPAVLVLAEASAFFGERAPAKPMKNQPNIPGVPDGDGE